QLTSSITVSSFISNSDFIFYLDHSKQEAIDSLV
ncbi:unnamed protein product, partial [Rotaria sp. Silwood1]